MRDEAVKVFSREFKLSTLRRMLSGENVSALARELRKITGVIVYLMWEARARRQPRGRGARRRRKRIARAAAVDDVLRAEPDEDEGQAELRRQARALAQRTPTMRGGRQASFCRPSVLGVPFASSR